VRHAAARFARRVAFAGAAASIAACSLLTSLDGLSNGGPDAAVRGADASTPDGTGPVVAPDSGGADALVEAAQPTPFCATITPKPKLCDDFERSETKGPWGEVVANGGGTIAVEPSTRGAGRELHATVPQLQGSDVAVGRVTSNFAEADQVILSYALRVDAPPVGSNGVQVMSISVSPPSSVGDYFATYVFVRSDGITFVEQTFPAGAGAGGSFALHPLAEPLSFGTWQRVDVVLTLAPAPHVKVTVDGKLGYEGTPDPFFRRGSPSVSGGVNYSFAPGGPLSVHVDDVYVDTK
jgi:hypothetical protein